MEIYVIENGEQAGPYTRFKIREKLAKGDIDEKSLAWYRGLDEWQPLSEIGPLQPFLGGEEREPETAEGPSIAESPPETPRVPAAGEQEYPLPVQAWIRFWARNLDFSYFVSLVALVAVVTGQMQTEKELQPTLAYMLILWVAWVFFETVLLSVFGNTPGRAFLGVKVTRSDGSGLSTAVALKRSLMVWSRGMGFGFIYFSIITMSVSFLELTRVGTTWWDNAADTKVTHGRLTLTRALIAVGLSILLSYLVFAALEWMNPKPGEGGSVDSPVR